MAGFVVNIFSKPGIVLKLPGGSGCHLCKSRRASTGQASMQTGRIPLSIRSAQKLHLSTFAIRIEN
jgi:hypothetical protein